MNNFWQTLKKPFLILAPMEDVTDTVFRQIIAKCGRPDVIFSEFTSCEGAQSVGQARVIHRLKFDKKEYPIVAQIWGVTPEDYYKTAKLIKELGFSGIDINMGCPVKKVIKMGACSALIKNPSLAKEIVEACKKGAGDLPVSIKTRIGFNQIQTEEWIGFILEQCRPAALTIHGRTVKEESKVPCHWDEIEKVVILNNQIYQNQPENKPLIIGNGDIQTYQEAQEKAAQYNLDGIMIGRGVFKNPWIFNPQIAPTADGQLVNTVTGLAIIPKDRLELLLSHLDLWDKTWGENKNYAVLKKYFKIYIQGFAGSSELRSRLMETKNPAEALDICREILPKLEDINIL